MTRTEIEEYLLQLEHELLIEQERVAVKLTREWAGRFPKRSAVYVLREDNEICYVGETGSMRGRMTDLLDTRNHTIRRNLGTALFSNHHSFEKASSKKKFSDEIEVLLNGHIEAHLTVSYLLVELGRKELEERLFGKFQPRYSLKGKRGGLKAYTKAEKQIRNRKAYEPWTAESDEKLERFFCEGKSINEMSKVFERNEGAIRSRIKKLELKEKYGG